MIVSRLGDDRSRVALSQKMFNRDVRVGGGALAKLLAELFEVAGRLALMKSLSVADGFRAERLGDVQHKKPGVMVARQIESDLERIASAIGVIGRM
jgi:hypothetical protein